MVEDRIKTDQVAEQQRIQGQKGEENLKKGGTCIKKITGKCLRGLRNTGIHKAEEEAQLRNGERCAESRNLDRDGGGAGQQNEKEDNN